MLSTSALIPLLITLAPVWEYAANLRSRIESGDISDDDLSALTELIQTTLYHTMDTDMQRKM
jgi:hypothetical protein